MACPNPLSGTTGAAFTFAGGTRYGWMCAAASASRGPERRTVPDGATSRSSSGRTRARTTARIGCFGRLWDGRWFALSAGCDNTGWDCQASGFALVAMSAEALIRLGLTDGELERFAPNSPERVAARVEPDTYM